MRKFRKAWNKKGVFNVSSGKEDVEHGVDGSPEPGDEARDGGGVSIAAVVRSVLDGGGEGLHDGEPAHGHRGLLEALGCSAAPSPDGRSSPPHSSLAPCSPPSRTLRAAVACGRPGRYEERALQPNKKTQMAAAATCGRGCAFQEWPRIPLAASRRQIFQPAERAP